MKVSKQTIDLLHWCSRIQEDLFIEAGSRLRTISQNKAILFEANVREVFPRSFPVRKLTRCLPYINESTEISFDDPSYMELRNGRILTKVPSVDERLILKPPSKTIGISAYNESFFIHSDDVYELRRLKCDRTVVEFHAAGPGSRIQIDYFDVGEADDPAPIRHSMDTMKSQFARQTFRARLKLSNLSIAEGSYQLDLAAVGVAKFTWLTGDATVWIAIEASHSQFSNSLS